MTLCVAAFTEGGNQIVAASDLRVSLGYTSGESLVKGAAVHPKWIAMFAEDDIGRVDLILEAAKQTFGPKPALKRQEIEAGFVMFMHQELTKRIEASVLSPYGLVLSEFVSRRGVESFTPDAYADIRRSARRSSWQSRPTWESALRW